MSNRLTGSGCSSPTTSIPSPQTATSSAAEMVRRTDSTTPSRFLMNAAWRVMGARQSEESADGPLELSVSAGLLCFMIFWQGPHVEIMFLF